MFIVNHPGPWQHYVNRSDNKGLNIMEIKSKYLKEQLLFEQYMSFQRQQQLLRSQNTSGGSSVGASSVGSGGIGSDGPLSGATVTARGVSVTTNELGEFVFPFELGSTEEITITGGTDSITGLAFEGELKGYITPTIKVVSPLTTLAYYDESAESFDKALDNVISVATNLGFTGISKDILTEDYVKKSVEENDDRAIALQAFTTYVDSIAEASAPTLKGVKTSTYGTPLTDKDAKIAMYKYFGKSKNISINSFIQDEGIELDETKNAIISNVGTAIESVLKTELTNVVNDNFADGNYRTTRIQGINRNIKNDIKTQVKSAIDSRSADLVKTTNDDITTLLTTTQADLKQVKTGVENKTNRVVDDSKEKSLVEVTNLFKTIAFSSKALKEPIGEVPQVPIGEFPQVPIGESTASYGPIGEFLEEPILEATASYGPIGEFLEEPILEATASSRPILEATGSYTPIGEVPREPIGEALSLYRVQNIYALTTDLKVGTKLYVKDTESNTYHSMNDVVTIKVEGRLGSIGVKCLAWALTNRENQPRSESFEFKSVILSSALDEGATAYFLDSTGVIIDIQTKKEK